MYEKLGQFIDGKWQQSSDKGTYDVINPAPEEIIGQASKATSQDVEDKDARCFASFRVHAKRVYIIRRIDKITLMRQINFYISISYIECSV